MSFAIVLSSEAVRDLARLPRPLLEFVENQMRWLAVDPVRRGTRSSGIPYPKGMTHPCSARYKGRRYHFNILFKYADTRSENTLLIIGIAVLPPLPS